MIRQQTRAAFHTSLAILALWTVTGFAQVPAPTLRALKKTALPNQLLLDDKGQLLVLTSGNEQRPPALLILDKQLREVKRFPLAQNSNPYAFALQKDEVVITHYLTHSLGRLDLTRGEYKSIFAPQPQNPTPLVNPQGVAVEGDLILAAYNHYPYQEPGRLLALRGNQPAILQLPVKNPQQIVPLSSRTWAINAGPYPTSVIPAEGTILFLKDRASAGIQIEKQLPLGTYPGPMKYSKEQNALYVCEGYEGDRTLAYRVSLAAENPSPVTINLGGHGWCAAVAVSESGAYFVNGESGELFFWSKNLRCHSRLSDLLPQFAPSWSAVDLVYDEEAKGLWLLTSMVASLSFLPLDARGVPPACR